MRLLAPALFVLLKLMLPVLLVIFGISLVIRFFRRS
jgi:hypothetical protein